MHKSIVGWDIGGAHIKAAVIGSDGKVAQVIQLPCPLWKGLDYLIRAVKNMLDQINLADCQHVITMTGELVDFFDGRDDGVKQIIQTMQNCLVDKQVIIYAGLEGLVASNQLENKHYAAIASANWLASSSYIASQQAEALFVDIGSTTTDLLIICNHQVKALGLTDYQRMRSDELVYTGIVRTPVMAIAQTASFLGDNIGLMAEYFASMADVYRLTGELNEAHDQTETADGGDKTLLASAQRLSRMTGYEYSANDLPIWKQFAENIKAQQKNKILQACQRQLSRQLISEDAIFIGAGVGRFLVKQIADDLGYGYCDFTDLIDVKYVNNSIDVADCAPAVAVALLACSI